VQHSRNCEIFLEVSVTITDGQVAVVRAMLSGDGAEYDRRTALLDRTNGWDRYTTLIAAAFFEAVDRRFGKGYTREEIIRFVADVRSRFDDGGARLNAAAAERLMLSALEDEDISDIDDKTVIENQIAFLVGLIADENLDRTGLDAFLEDARKLADEWSEPPDSRVG
jgi:hypothetical protein